MPKQPCRQWAGLQQTEEEKRGVAADELGLQRGAGVWLQHAEQIRTPDTCIGRDRPSGLRATERDRHVGGIGTILR
ncbi:MAG: hypothetical protein EOM91_18185 [Sphingobacteriia bacterium]|nr:hypothetical protein [Sphingobacteriia bacterium]